MDTRVREILNFNKNYKKAKNASTGSKYDSNANVTEQNIATMQAESIKKLGIDVQRQMAYNYLKRDFGRKVAKQYLKDLKHHIIYTNDESTLGGYPYCASISLYPFLLNGLKGLGGSSGVPKHAASFVGGLVNLIFLVAGQFAGAVAVVEFLPYLDHFLRLDYGQDYINHVNDNNGELRHKICDLFQEFVFAICQPAGSRNYQSPFTNIAYYDEPYFKSLFKDFFFPDGDEPCWETTKELQKIFMLWFIEERNKEVLTFPVETFNLLNNGTNYVDEEIADFVAEAWSKGGSFFLYTSDSVDALSSCCRLKNTIEEDNVFSYTLGAGSIQTGSKRVITLNINRIVQDWYRKSHRLLFKYKCSLNDYITEIVCRVHKYLESWNNKLWDDYDTGLLTVYKEGFIDLDKQYLTVGFNGFLEAGEFLSRHKGTKYTGLKIDANDTKYKELAKDTLETIKELNKKHRKAHVKFNTEMIPAESVGLKHYKWDKEDGYWVPKDRNCYNSYFYPVEDESYDIIRKIYLQGKDFIGCLDGGSACHLNLETILSKEQYRTLMNIFVKAGCTYSTFNTVGFQCEDCGYISKVYGTECPKCHSKNITFFTRIIGYLKKVKYWSDGRQQEFKKRYLSKDKEVKNKERN